jgi:hypothetical protein
MISVSMVGILSPLCIGSIIDMSKETNNQTSLSQALNHIGANVYQCHCGPFHLQSFLPGKTIGLSVEAGFLSWRPVLLTMSLFLGPLVLKSLDVVCFRVFGPPLFCH